MSQTASAGQLVGVSSLEHAVQLPAPTSSGDVVGAGTAPAEAAARIARRSPFTGRVTYVDPQGARALRNRVPRPILASASLMAMAVGMFVATAGAPGASAPDAPALTPSSVTVTVSPSDLGATR